MELRTEQVRRILANTAGDTNLDQSRVNNTVKLFLEGSTVPFIARYRKEMTGELDEVAIRSIEERYTYYTALEERKNTILATIEDQGKLTDELRDRIEGTLNKTELEDLYLPYKPKRRTKATIAREHGLEPLADILAAQELTRGTPEECAEIFVDAEKGVDSSSAALEGAGYILAERLSDNADARDMVRRLTRQKGIFVSKVDSDHAQEVTKFEMYYDYKEPLSSIPSHRMLAMRRGMEENILLLSIEAPEEEIIENLKRMIVIRPSIFSSQLEEIATDAYHRLLETSIELELFSETKARADEVAIRVFADNLRNLLLASPAGGRCVLGIDPGIRTGSKCVVVDQTGRFLHNTTIYPHAGAGRITEATEELLDMIVKWHPEIIAIGNGTAGREMEQFVRTILKNEGKSLPVVMVNESGASIYSASEIAREEFPDLDLTVRGAISIARRLQDPLAELVKLDPKNIGVGQYQHDVNQMALQQSLDTVVESCVNFVGVELNTASWALLAYVSGIGPALSKAIVMYRDSTGPFKTRHELMNVPRFGAKAFEQAAGFLRIRKAVQPLDATAVHPERYALVEHMATDLNSTIEQMIADPGLLEKIELAKYVSEDAGMPTLRDIITELKKPGRDPRAEFSMPEFRDDVMTMADLEQGMILQGTVTNVTNFGAFVDIGVHQDGLVHISHLAHSYVEDPSQVVKAGQIVKVKVLEVDEERKRISLSIKEASEPPAREKGKKKQTPRTKTAFDSLDNLFT